MTTKLERKKQNKSECKGNNNEFFFIKTNKTIVFLLIGHINLIYLIYLLSFLNNS